MLKIAICDDETTEREEIIHMVNRALNLNNILFKIFEFSTGEHLTLSSLDFDIYFLDIKMDKLTGIEVAKKIRLVSEHAVIIFITGLKDYVFDALMYKLFITF